jgi:hypothetical protein
MHDNGRCLMDLWCLNEWTHGRCVMELATDESSWSTQSPNQSITYTILPRSRSRTIHYRPQCDELNERMDMNLLRSDLEYQPKQITDIKKFLEIARRKDAKCEPIPQIGQVGRGRHFRAGRSVLKVVFGSSARSRPRSTYLQPSTSPF